jgi:hypothetical protein
VIKQLIVSGELSVNLSLQKFNRHKLGTDEYIIYARQKKEKSQSPPSILYIDFNTAQDIVIKYAGTGILTNKCCFSEYIDLPFVVGCYEYQGSLFETNRVEIIYTKKNAHLYPVKEKI